MGRQFIIRKIIQPNSILHFFPFIRLMLTFFVLTVNEHNLRSFMCEKKNWIMTFNVVIISSCIAFAINSSLFFITSQLVDILSSSTIFLLCALIAIHKIDACHFFYSKHVTSFTIRIHFSSLFHINFNYCTNKVFQSSHQLDYTIWYAQSEKNPSAARK